MDADFWAKMHGAATHFPLALALVSGPLDAAGFVLAARPLGRELKQVGSWAILLGALGSVPAVFSGLFLTKGLMLGHGALRMHHLFVWPAFALLIGLATWRKQMGDEASRPVFAGYLCGVGVLAGLLAAAGHWGGEMILH